MQDEFLAMLSHELRTPMSAMLGWLHLLKTGKLSPEQQRRARSTSIERNALVQTQLVNDLLDVSRIVSGKMELETEAMRARPRARERGRLGAPRRPRRAASSWCRTSPREPCSVVGDAERLQQIFCNLLVERDQVLAQGRRVEIRLERDGDHARVTVTDQGEGIDAEILPHVFERFRQADSSTRRRHGGLGLGLAIVRSLVELHGGTVTRREPRRGQGRDLHRHPAARRRGRRRRAGGAGRAIAAEADLQRHPRDGGRRRSRATCRWSRRC